MKRVNWVDLSHFIPIDYSTNCQEKHSILLLIRAYDPSFGKNFLSQMV